MNIFPQIKKSKFLTDFISMFSSNISLFLIGILISIIKTRSLGPEGLGLYAILTNFSLLFVSLAELGIRQSTIYLAGKNDYDPNQILSANFYIWFISSIIGVIIYYFIFRNSAISVSKSTLIISSLIIPATIANSFIGGIMIGMDKIRKSANFNFTNGLFNLILVIIFLWFVNLGIFGAIISLLIPTISLIFRKYSFLNKNLALKFDFNFNPVLIKKLIGYGILYGVALFLMTNQKRIPILLMPGKINDYDIGIYNAGFAIAALLYNIYTALSPIIFVRSARAKDETENSKQLQKLMRVVFLLLLLFSILLYFVLDIFIPIMYGVKYIASIPIAKILLLGIIFYNVFLILNMDLAGRGKPWVAIMALIPTTLFNLLSNFYFISNYGIEGAAYCTSVSLAIGTFLFLILYSKTVKMPLKVIITPRKTDWDFIQKLLKKDDCTR